MKRHLCYLTALLLTAWSCEEAVERDINNGAADLLAVESVITNERMRHLVKLSLPYRIQNQAPEPATGATVTLSSGLQSVDLVEFPQGSGMYYTPELRAVTGRDYTLRIEYRGRIFIAIDRSVPVEPLQELRYHRTPGGFVLDEHPAGQDANFIDHRIIWSHTPACAAGDRCEGKVVFYDLKTIDVNEIFKPEKEVFAFPANSIIIRKKFSVSGRYREFLRSMLSETEWRGGVFDVQRANPPTNIIGGAVGFFAVSTVVSDTTIVR